MNHSNGSDRSGGLRAALAAAAMLASAGAAHAQFSQGPDVVYTDAQSVFNWGSVGGVRGYSLGSYTCNIGDANLLWGNQWNGTPALAMNAYRLHDGRLLQIGLSFVKYSCCAAVGTGCGLPCNGQGGSRLGAGCRDVYGASYNGSQSLLGPRSQINVYTGQITRVSGASGDAAFRRLQVRESDLSSANYPGALYFVEGVYVAPDDAAAGNSHNNASYKRVTVGAGFDLNVTGPMYVGDSALYAWREHGNGPNQPDNSVEIVNADIPDEGRFHVASKVTDLGDGTWRYDYAVFNLNSHRSAGAFSVPLPPGATVTNVGFHDVDYHSGEPYSNTDWNSTVSLSDVTWTSPETYDQNVNANALRWGTTYNFWFDADAAPGRADAVIGLFRPGTPDTITVNLQGPAGAPCAPDFDGDGQVTSADFFAFLDAFFKGDTAADFDTDGQVTSADFFGFLDAFFEGCA